MSPKGSLVQSATRCPGIGAALRGWVMQVWDGHRRSWPRRGTGLRRRLKLGGWCFQTSGRPRGRRLAGLRTFPACRLVRACRLRSTRSLWVRQGLLARPLVPGALRLPWDVCLCLRVFPCGRYASDDGFTLQVPRSRTRAPYLLDRPAGDSPRPFTSVKELTAAIGAFVDHWNDHPRPFA
jgi:hypothetical protein